MATTTRTASRQAKNAADPRLQELLDRTEILELIYSYGAALDRRDYAGFDRILTEDFVADYGPLGSWTDRTSFAAGVKMILDASGFTHHLIASPIVRVDGDSAESESFVLCPFVAPADPAPLHLITSAIYKNEFRRTPDGWRISRLTEQIVWMSDGGEATGQRFPGLTLPAVLPPA